MDLESFDQDLFGILRSLPSITIILSRSCSCCNVLAHFFACLLIPQLIGANMGVTKMTKEHLGLALALKIPIVVVITKIDICPVRRRPLLPLSLPADADL